MTDNATAMLPDQVPREFRCDLYIPRYRPMAEGDWRLQVVPMALNRGLWSPAVLVRDMAILSRREQDDWISWMSMTPFEIETQEIGVRRAEGHTVVMGLGMGWAAVNAALRDQVTAVTVVEFDPAIISLMRTQQVLDQIPAAAAAKVRIIQGDAYVWRPDGPVDVLLADIWQPHWAPNRIREVARMHANTGARRVHYFGQEMELAHMVLSAGQAIGPLTLSDAAAETGLPLIGPDQSDYAEKVSAAAAHWYRPNRLPAPPMA